MKDNTKGMTIMLKRNFTLLAFIVFLSASLLNAAEQRTLLSGSIYQKSAQDSSYVVVQNMNLSFFLQGELVTSVMTDEAGSYSVENLKEGTYLLVAESVDGESFGATSLPVKYEESNLVVNFKMTNVGIQKLPADFDPMGKGAVRGQEESDEILGEGEESVAVQLPNVIMTPTNNDRDRDRDPAFFAYGLNSNVRGYGGGCSGIAMAAGVAGIVLGAVALADDDEPVSPYK